jgi:hypothetical protein
MRLIPLIAGAFIGFLSCLPGASAASFSVVPFTTDATSGVSASNSYTHAVDFEKLSPTSTVVNGVTFTAGDFVGSNYSLTGASSGNEPGLMGSPAGFNKVFSQYLYNSNSGESLHLSGLTVGVTYDLRLYSNGSKFTGSSELRYSVALFNGSASLPPEVNPLQYKPQEGDVGHHYFECEYTAKADNVTLNFNRVTTSTGQYLLSGFSNQIVVPAATPEPASLVLVGIASMMLVRRR